MRWYNTTIAVSLLLLFIGCDQSRPRGPELGYALVVHGGAGTIRQENMTTEKEKAYREAIEEALLTGKSVLQSGGSSLDAVEHVITVMEDNPLFNAGKGAVFTAEGTNELDASIMDGNSLNSGAVSGVKRVKNPIQLARLVMSESPHILLYGNGAEVFARRQGVQMVPKDYFFTQSRWDALQRRIKREQKASQTEVGDTLGTVGTVALDQNGNLAAGTSTGGLTYKRFGRIGDSPVIGAGTYANNVTCAVSATGHGEYFMRSVVAYDISALMEYKGLAVQDAAEKVIMEKLVELGGTGGVIALDTKGNFAMPFNTSGMYRGYLDKDGNPVVKIYREE